MESIQSLNDKIICCKRCPRLVSYTRDIAVNKVRRFKDHTYHGKPVPGFGDVNAKLLIIGLAPAAHGANRTGRMFTGDSSGDWLAKVMYKHGFASIPTSQSSDDGLCLTDAYVTAAVRCAPPQNKPAREERDACFEYLQHEKNILKNVTTVLCLGAIAHATACRLFGVKPERFGHNKVAKYQAITIVTSYHPSRQNTQTGRLTWRQWSAVFARARRLIQ